MRYRSRRANYRLFRERLNVPLVAVELAYGSEFELSEQDAEILIQLRGGDILWQKERLLNLALRALPTACRIVMWVDCDIIFESDDWLEPTIRLLDRFMLVQPFSYVHRMPRAWVPGDDQAGEWQSLQSLAFAVASGLPPAAALNYRTEGKPRTPGYAWAARREFLDKHGFYDGCIVGGGDRAMACAAYGHFEITLQRQHLVGRAETHYLNWAKPYRDDVDGKISVVEGNIFHLWHGAFDNRRYRDRYTELGRFQFDPFEDIALDDNGCWRWNSNKPELHKYVYQHFASRKDDE
jgi:hypothetical protein